MGFEIRLVPREFNASQLRTAYTVPLGQQLRRNSLSLLCKGVLSVGHCASKLCATFRSGGYVWQQSKSNLSPDSVLKILIL